MHSLPRRCAVAALVAVVAVLAVAGPATADARYKRDPVANLSRARQRALADEVVRLAIGGQDRVDARPGVHDLAMVLGREPTMNDVRDLATRVASRRVAAVFGDRFRVDDAQAPQVHKAVSSTLAIPDATFAQIAATGLSVWVGRGDISKAPGGDALNGTQPEVDGARSWSTIHGVYILGDQRILVDAVDDQGTPWALLHEFGHALDFALGLSQSSVVKEVQPRIARAMMDDYYYDPNNLDDTRREFVAETVSWYLAMGYTEFRAQTSSKALADYYRRNLGAT